MIRGLWSAASSVNASPAQQSIPTSFMRYLINIDTVEGWFSRTSALVMAQCLSIQQSEGITGSIAEIGIHHGKSFLALACAARPGERLFAIDVFERQDLNVDGSGCGNREIFERNLRTFAPDANVTILPMSSVEVRGREREIFGAQGLRFLSIDGGHTRELTRNDLEIADAALVDGGICCVDDIFNFEWPGVISGVFEFLSQNSNLVPIAYFSNKLYWSRPAFLNLRRNQLREIFGSKLLKKDQEFGAHQIDVYAELLTQ